MLWPQHTAQPRQAVRLVVERTKDRLSFGDGEGEHPGRAGERVLELSNALAAGMTVYEPAGIMGTSVAMIEVHDGPLLDTAHESLVDRLEAIGA